LGEADRPRHIVGRNQSGKEGGEKISWGDIEAKTEALKKLGGESEKHRVEKHQIQTQRAC